MPWRHRTLRTHSAASTVLLIGLWCCSWCGVDYTVWSVGVTHGVAAQHVRGHLEPFGGHMDPMPVAEYSADAITADDFFHKYVWVWVWVCMHTS